MAVPRGCSLRVRLDLRVGVGCVLSVVARWWRVCAGGVRIGVDDAGSCAGLYFGVLQLLWPAPILWMSRLPPFMFYGGCVAVIGLHWSSASLSFLWQRLLFLFGFHNAVIKLLLVYTSQPLWCCFCAMVRVFYARQL